MVPQRLHRLCVGSDSSAAAAAAAAAALFSVLWFSVL